MKRLPAEFLSLQTPRARLAVFALSSLAVYLSRYHWLDHLSIWGDLGIKRAPSIGLTRAYWLLLHGHPAEAWHRNALIYLVLAIGLPLLVRDLISLTRKKHAQPLTPQTML